MADAYSWYAKHPIFTGPFAVKMTVTDQPTPESFYQFPHYFEGGKAPDKLPMWRVQVHDYSEPFADETLTSLNLRRRIGMVSRPGGYTDSPDAEYISGGACAKSPDAIAIGRHGNFFHWGFSASPDDMTEEAKPVLANAIVYTSKFAGQTPIARKYNDRFATRSYVTDRKQFITREAHQQQVKSLENFNTYMSEQKVKAEAKQARGEPLDQSETAALSSRPQQIPTYENFLQNQVRGLYGQFGADIAAYHKYFDDNYDYFYCINYDLDLDEDAKSLGISNHDKRILDEAIKMLETGKDVEKGKRILSRYTIVDFATPAEWRKWYNTYKDLFFFTESGGWVFLINSRDPGLNDYKAHEIRRAVSRMVTEKTNDHEPVAVAADVVVLQDGNRVLNVKLAIHPGYHIYNYVSKSDPFIATEVEVVLPDGYTVVGSMKAPSGEFYNQSGTTVFHDSVVLSQAFSGAGTGELTCKVSYQCCDSSICFPPSEKIFTIKL